MLTLWSSHTSTSLLHSQINHFLQTNLRRGHGSRQQPSYYYPPRRQHQATSDQQPPQPLPSSPAQGISHHEEVIDEATALLNSDLKDRVARIAAHEAHVPLRDIEQVYVSEVADDHIHLQMMTCDVDTNQCVAIEKDVVFDHQNMVRFCQILIRALTSQYSNPSSPRGAWVTKIHRDLMVRSCSTLQSR